MRALSSFSSEAKVSLGFLILINFEVQLFLSSWNSKTRIEKLKSPSDSTSTRESKRKRDDLYLLEKCNFGPKKSNIKLWTWQSKDRSGQASDQVLDRLVTSGPHYPYNRLG